MVFTPTGYLRLAAPTGVPASGELARKYQQRLYVLAGVHLVCV